mgnify:CR=1 FL=1
MTITSEIKRVSFQEEAEVHYIKPLHSKLVCELFYQKADYERFRYERQMEIQRNLRAENSLLRRARRSSIDIARTNAYHGPSCQGQPYEQYILMREMERSTRRNLSEGSSRRGSSAKPGVALAA